MIGVGRQASGFNQPQQQVMNVSSLPAPNKGIDARMAVGDMSPLNCIYAYNLVPADRGMLVRNGYREWAVDLEITPGLGLGVRSLIVFDGTVTEPSDNRLFAVTNEGIWDVTTFDSPPVLKATFVNIDGDAGHGVYAHYTDQSGDTFLYFADSANGLYEYQASTDLWAPASGITGPDLTKVAFVVVHKQRIWLVEQDSAVGWYLPIASKNGQATEFFFGPKFSHGGELNALINWTVDGGEGVDDYLVAVSSAGDVIPYKGIDPEVVTGVGLWQSTGTYYIGKLPNGRRGFSEFSGELYLLSSFGLISMRDLLTGVESRDTSNSSLTFPIASILRRSLRVTSESLGWEPIFIPNAGYLVITSPLHPTTGRYIQYGMSLAVEGWGLWRDIPATSVSEWDSKLFFGTPDNRVCVLDVPRDNVLLDQEDPDKDGVPISFSILTAYNDGGAPGVNKRGQMVRTDFLTELPLSFRTKLLYDYEVAETVYAVDSLISNDISVWDASNWDEAVWGSGFPVGQNKLQGAGGMGRFVAVAVQGTAVDTARLLSFDVMWTDGGPI